MSPGVQKACEQFKLPNNHEAVSYTNMLIYLITAFQNLQLRTQQSIKRTWQDCLSNDWLEPEKAKKILLSISHTDHVWTKKVQRIPGSRKAIKDLNEILGMDGAGEKPLNFFEEGRKYHR